MSPEKTWRAKKIKDPEAKEAEEFIDIYEDLSLSVNMDPIEPKPDKAPTKKSRLFGIPLDAEEIVNLMKDLLIRLKCAGLDLSKLPYEKIEVNNEEALRVLGQLLITSFGMTLDRSLILKILSQPGCEGVRFYLCEKKGKLKDEFFISLALVGVDQMGQDLLYVEQDDPKKNPFKHVTTTSLTGEYGHPPTARKIVGESRYSLLRIAERRALEELKEKPCKPTATPKPKE